MEREEDETPITDEESAPATKRRVDIKGSVGADGDNNPQDIRTIEAALVKRGYLDSVDVPMAKLINAISKYQLNEVGFKVPDGRVDVDNRTIRALNKTD